MKRKNLISESGAIMLEVVAVLSLMGLMGAMLFRQMYVRNQELHNIQMASEIRVVKDAFAAWIQAESTRLGVSCPVASALDATNTCAVTDDEIDAIKDFLPEGYFSNEDGAAIDRGAILKDNYILKLVGYRRGNKEPGILTYYGVVIPNPEVTLPSDESWNFRRAARVAMLIGVDGGAYDRSITENLIAGAVGTWNLPAEDFIEDENIPTYVAITGTDVFQPEIDIPDLKLGLPEHWDVAIQNQTAYGVFTAGATSDCYQITSPRTTSVDADGFATLQRDKIHAAGSNNCFPAFFVEADTGTGAAHKATGNVHVLNDLTVGREWDGADAGKSAMRFDKDGMIVFEKAEVADPQAATTGTKVNYMLDPKYTSVMNDIKLMSRGGASLSDILPNYILKGQQTHRCDLGVGPGFGNECTLNASVTCPTGYKAAVAVIPTQFGVNFVHGSSTTISTTSEDGHSHNVTVPSYESHRLWVELLDSTTGSDMSQGIETTSNRKDFAIKMGYRDASGNIITPTTNEYVRVILQTYCVFDPNNIDWDNDGTVDGTDKSPDKNRTMDAATCGRIKVENVCTNMGCQWTAGACQVKTVSP